jgi:CHAT domain-containing protein/Tfp pilus assembly protein PilF
MRAVAGNGQEKTDLFDRATSVYWSGDSRQALQLLDEALAEMPVDDAARVFLLQQKAEWLRESGYPEAGAAALDEVARELDRLPRSGHETEWSAFLTEQAVVAQRRGDFKAAETLLAEAETLAQESPARDLLLPDTFANQASLYLDQGELSKAQDVLLAALEMDQRTGNKRSESNDLNMLGLVYGRLGDADTSKVYLRKAFDVAYQAGLIREATHAMINLAALLDEAGDHEGAAKMFSDVERMMADGGDESGVACSVANLGVAASQAGDLERAMTLLTRSHQLHQAVGNWLHSVQDLLNLSNTEARRNRFGQALSYAEQALAAAHEHGLVELLWAAEYTVANCRTIVAAESADEKGALEALEGYRRAADVVELLRSKVDRPEEREWFLADKEGIYDAAIALCLGLHRAREAFQFCERARMRSFLEALGSTRIEQLEANDPGAERHDQLVAQLLSPLTPAGEKPGLMDELRVLRAETTARRPALAAITEAELPTEDDIRTAIPAETCVLEYFQFDNSVVVFLLDRDGLKDCNVMRPEEPVEAIIWRLRNEIDDGNTELAAGNLLFDALLQPVMPKLAETTDLIIVPHRSLHYVPFSALWYEQGSDDAPSRKYLRTRFNLTTVPSASYLPNLAHTAAPDPEYGPAVVLGNPTGDLAGADLEARRVAARLGVTAQLGASATRDALLGAGAPAVLHVAGHGEYNKEDPLLSGLALADGVITVEDLLSSGPAPGLFVLSGCVTGMSKRRPGDELIGLAQAALRSGTRSIVATLWETLDESSTLFFEHFYESLTEGGATVSQAITWARDALATGPGGYDQPVDWAPFLLIGDPDQRLIEPDRAPTAQINRGLELLDQGDKEGAKNVFEHVASSSSPRSAARAAFNLAMLLDDQGDSKGALAAWRQAADSAESEVASVAIYRVGEILAQDGDQEGARVAYLHAIDSNHPEAAPRAALNLGALLFGQADLKGARAAWQRAIDSGHHEVLPKAAINLGGLLAEQGDTEGAQASYQRAIDTGDDELAPEAAFKLGTLLAQQGDAADARIAFQTAIDSNHRDAAPAAAYNLGVMLARQDDVRGALAAFQIAANSDNADTARNAAAAIAEAAAALVRKGAKLDELGQREQAANTYDEVVARFGDAPEPELRELVGAALINKSIILDERGQWEQAADAYDQVVTRFGQASEPPLRELAARALATKGVMLGKLGRPKQAADAYDQVVTRFSDAPEPGSREWVARALLAKGVLLSKLGRPEQAADAYNQLVTRFSDAQEPLLRGHVAAALINKGIGLDELGQPEQAADAYDQVVTRFSDAPEPALREQVARALRLRAEIKGG